MSYQTYIPDEWREMQEREREATAKAEAERTGIKQLRAARWKRALYTLCKTVGWVAVGLMALLVVTAGLLAITGGRRR